MPFFRHQRMGCPVNNIHIMRNKYTISNTDRCHGPDLGALANIAPIPNLYFSIMGKNQKTAIYSGFTSYYYFFPVFGWILHLAWNTAIKAYDRKVFLVIS